MADSIAHRGPDDEGVLWEAPVGLAFRRLAILDLSPSGHQPMESEDGRLTIVFNGEIYNYIELRDELRQLGFTFPSSGDTAVLLAAYQAWGESMLGRLHGMFAFVILDRRDGTLFGARDRFGVKPFFLAKAPWGVAFASEIKAIRAILPTRLDQSKLRKLCSVGRVDMLPYESATFIEGVEELPPGHAVRITPAAGVGISRWWSLDSEVERQRALPGDPTERFLDLLVDAVRLRMRSDVPVGVMLSGGLDSTTVACLMALEAAKTTGPTSEIHAFSFQDPAFDESAYIRDTVQRTGMTLHTTAPPDANGLLRDLEQIVALHDEPVHSAAAVVGFGLYRLARANDVKVVLGGQGADETLGGYPSYYPFLLSELCLSGHLGRFRHERLAAVSRGVQLPGLAGTVRRIIANACRRIPAYRRLVASRRAHEGSGWASSDMVDREWLGDLRSAPEPFSLNGILREGLESFPLPLYLRIEDRNAMGNSVEGRLPFMDYRLVSLSFAMDSSAKIRDGETKRILRDSTRTIIPESVASRTDKMGFPVDHAALISTTLRPLLLDLLHSTQTTGRGVFDVPRLRSMAASSRPADSVAGEALFQFLQVELWLRTLES